MISHYIFILLFLLSSKNIEYSYGEPIEKKSCEIFLNDILVMDEKSSSNDLLQRSEFINSIIERIDISHSLIFYEGFAYELSEPYDDSTDYYVNLYEGVYNDSSLAEIEQLFLDYKKQQALKRDSILLCESSKVIKSSFIQYIKNEPSNTCFLKVYNHIESDLNKYVEIELYFNRYEFVEFYLVFDLNSDYQYYFINKF